VKSLTKEDVVPRAADHWCITWRRWCWWALCFSRTRCCGRAQHDAVNLDAACCTFRGGRGDGAGDLHGGWSSHNKYSLLGAMRAIAQMVSYEIPLILSSVAVIMIAGTLSTVKIVELQARYSNGLAHWYVFTPWGWRGSSCL